MQFDPTNEIVQLCAQGVEMEGQGKPEEAGQLFMQAWDKAASPVEKFTAAHYVARHQNTIAQKLQWDETALQFALQINDDAIKATLPSLYLNIGKCYEDLGDFTNAEKQYQLALSFTNFLNGDGYGNMIKNGILNGLERIH